MSRREIYESPQLHFGVALMERQQRTIPGAGAPVLLRTWTWGRWVVTECPHCRCSPDKPCRIELEDDRGEAACVPAGAYGIPRCSSCAS
jgi:hypothetical protein